MAGKRARAELIFLLMITIIICVLGRGGIVVDEQPRLNVNISAKKLESLLRSGYLRAEDIQCHNRTAKDRIRRICLEACGRRLRFETG